MKHEELSSTQKRDIQFIHKWLGYDYGGYMHPDEFVERHLPGATRACYRQMGSINRVHKKKPFKTKAMRKLAKRKAKYGR